MRKKYYRAIVWDSFFNPYASNKFYDKGWEYKNLLAIYNEDHPKVTVGGNKYFLSHPNYFLYINNIQSEANACYIPFDCKANCKTSTKSYTCCSQWSANPGPTGWRKKFIKEQKSTLAKGQYAGTFIDDINIYQIHVSSPDGSGTLVVPWDVHTNAPMKYNDWVSYHADFLTAIKNTLPGEKIGNVYWAAHKSKTKDTERVLLQLDYVLLERGFNDAGLTGGVGPYSMDLYMKWIDYLHSIGVHFATLEREKANDHRRDVALAYYLLTTNGNDILGSNYHNWATHQSWWSGWDIDLGRAKSNRLQHPNGIWERKFQKGIVLAAEPGQKPINVKLSRPMKLLQKPGIVNNVTLKGRTCKDFECEWPDGVTSSEVAILLY